MRRLVATEDRPAYLAAMVDLLIAQPALESTTTLVCRVHSRNSSSGSNHHPAQLCLLELRASISLDGRHMCLGSRLTPETPGANAGMDRFFFDLGRGLNVDLSQVSDLSAQRARRRGKKEASRQSSSARQQRQRRPSSRKQLAAASAEVSEREASPPPPPVIVTPTSSSSKRGDHKDKPRRFRVLAEAAAIAAADAAAADDAAAAVVPAPLGSPQTSSFDNQQRYLLERSLSLRKTPHRRAVSRQSSSRYKPNATSRSNGTDTDVADRSSRACLAR